MTEPDTPNPDSEDAPGQALPAGPAWRPWALGRPGEQVAFLALSGMGTGLSPLAPGTAGTLAAWALWRALDMPAAAWLVAGVLTFFAGVRLVTRAQQVLGVKDPGWIVIDEIAAFWMVLGLVAPENALAELACFVAFRVFDAGKPWPVGAVDRRVPGALGVMADDVVAAVQAAAVVLAGMWALGVWPG